MIGLLIFGSPLLLDSSLGPGSIEALTEDHKATTDETPFLP